MPTGIDSTGTGSCTFMFARGKWDEPVVRFPCPDSKASIVVRCSPILYKHRNKNNVLTNLPYRMIFAVATFSNVLLYDTSQVAPIGMISEIHYAAITDMSWSSDGSILSISSNDGYCTFVHFEDGELGERLETQNIPSFMKREFPKVILPKVQKNSCTPSSLSSGSSSSSSSQNRAVLIPLSTEGEHDVTTTTTATTTTETTTATTTTTTTTATAAATSTTSNKKRAVLIPLTTDLTAAKPSAAFM